eukprot:TRINITY_DN2905_c0_g1_i4.p4 TRINITY_DN2905_c0_g1~~TRINITY_DN2905_c0_g1_i4.p4  ORF type:complete len:240 (-),score=81.44 TRINITY_DN2905_c0_g1_i4:1093-1812(-)
MRAEGKTEHVPYRNSPLTKILKSSLGGNSRTFIVLCATPMHSQYEQTLGTIRFGMSAKRIENVISANITSHNNGDAYELIINEYEERLKEMEKLRGADKRKVEYMVSTIAELQRQKESLNELLKKIGEKRLRRNLEEKCNINVNVRPKCEKTDFYKPSAGVIFTNVKTNYISEGNSESSLVEYDPKGVFALSALRNEKAKSKVSATKLEVLSLKEKHLEAVNTKLLEKLVSTAHKRRTT